MKSPLKDLSRFAAITFAFFKRDLGNDRVIFCSFHIKFSFSGKRELTAQICVSHFYVTCQQDRGIGDVNKFINIYYCWDLELTAR